MHKMTNKTQFLIRESLNKTFSRTLLLFVIVSLMTIPLIVAFEFDNQRGDLKFGDAISKYGKIEIREWFGLKKLADLELKTNTEVCNGIECEAVKEITLYESARLVDDVRFKLLVNGKWINGDISEHKFQVKVNGKWKDYNYETMDAGTYEVRLTGKIGFLQIVDWQIKSQGIWIEDWAVWTSSLSDSITYYYSFDETSGTNLPDMVNGSKNATFNAEPSWVSGILFNSAYFNNSLRANTSIKTPLGAQSFSVWFNTTKTSQYLLSSHDAYNVGGYYIQIDAGGKVAFVACDTGVEVSGTYSEATTVNDGAWHHLIMAFDGTDKWNMYLDGVNMSLVDNDGTLAASTEEFMIGSIRATGYWTGGIDEFGMWNRTLNQSEATQLYNSGTSLPFEGESSTIQVKLTSPSDNLITINDTLFFNATGLVYNANFTNATLYIWNSTYNTRTNTTLITGKRNYTRLSLSSFEVDIYKWNYYFCGLNASSDTFCEWSETNRTFTLTPFIENSQTYNATTVGSSLESFTINITYNESFTVVTGLLEYNGTNYAGTKTSSGKDTLFTSSLNVPLFDDKQNVTFKWKFSLTSGSGTYQKNSTSQNQTINLINTSIFGIPYTVPFINFTVYDEKTLAIINSTLAATLSYGVENTNKDLSYEDTTEANSSFSFAFDPPDKYFTVKGSMEFTSTGYGNRLYTLMEQVFSNTTSLINIYLLNSSDSTSFVIKVRDSSFADVIGATVHIQRYYPGTGKWITTEVVETNYEGKALGNFETEDVNYRFLVYVNGILELTSSSTKITCEVLPCTITLTLPGDTEIGLFRNLTDFDYTLVYSKATETFTYNYIDSDVNAQGGRLRVLKYDAGNATILEICNVSNAGSSSALSCDISAYTNGTYVAYAYNNRLGKLNELVDTLVISKVRDIVGEIGLDGVLWSVFLIIGIVMIGLIKPVVAVMLALFGLIAISWIGIISIPPLAISAIVFVGVIILWEMRK